jgi:hypothetical protein
MASGGYQGSSKIEVSDIPRFQGLRARLCAQSRDGVEEGRTFMTWHSFEDEIINDRFMHRIHFTCCTRLDRRHRIFEVGANIDFSDGRGHKLASRVSGKPW